MGKEQGKEKEIRIKGEGQKMTKKEDGKEGETKRPTGREKGRRGRRETR